MSISRVFDAYLASRDVPEVESTFGELHFEYACASTSSEVASEALDRAVAVAAVELGLSAVESEEVTGERAFRSNRGGEEHAHGG